MGVKPLNVLLVEDDSDYVRLALAALELGNVSCQVNSVADGIEAMDYLHQRGDFSEATRPDLILLDMNLPRKSGGEVFREIKNHAELGSIPIVFLTTADRVDIKTKFNIPLNQCRTKPTSMREYVALMQEIKSDLDRGQLKQLA